MTGNISSITALSHPLARLAARVPVAMLALDLSGQCTAMSDYWRQMTGRDPADAAGAGWLAAFDDQDRERIGQLWRRAADSASAIDSDAKLRSGSGVLGRVLVRLLAERDEAGHLIAYSGAIVDVSRMRGGFELPPSIGGAGKGDTRALLLAQLEDRLAHGRQRGPICAIHHLDLDHFRDFNEAVGHGVGDLVLQLIGERLSACMRSDDLVFRYEDDEFIVVQCDLPSTSDAMLMADRLMRIVAEPVTVSGKRLYVTASIGTCIPRPTEHDMELILQHAELALHRAKEEGNNTFRLYEPEIDQRTQRRATLATDLRRAIALEDELFLAYQPQIDLNSGETVGIEAFLRWRHPALGVLMPADFIPAAEKSGVMRNLGFWVLNTALRQGAWWLKEGFAVPLLTVNLSAMEARAPTLEYDIAAALVASGFPADRLELDINEMTFLEATRSESRLFVNLRRMGVQFAIDDFGRGYSSLKHLRLFPVNRLKIAGEFVKNTDKDRDNAAIVEAVITLARSLGHQVIAEGIETAMDASFLRLKGCEAGQGYFFARPMVANEIERSLRQGGPFQPQASAAGSPITVEKVATPPREPPPPAPVKPGQKQESPR